MEAGTLRNICILEIPACEKSFAGQTREADPLFAWGRLHERGSNRHAHRSIRRGSGHSTSEGWFVVIGGDPLRVRVAASTSL